MTDQPDPLRIDFHLLDRQIVDAAGEPVGKVDDVELTLNPATGRLQVTALLSGQQVLGERILILHGAIEELGDHASYLAWIRLHYASFRSRSPRPRRRRPIKV